MGRRKLNPADPKDRRTIIRHPTRLALARLCKRSPGTIGDLGRQMGMEDGALRGTVKKMQEWTVLVEGPGSSARRRIYYFSPAWEPELAEAIRRHRPLDLLPGQHGVLLNAPLPADASLEDVAWVVEFDEGGGSLLAVADDADASTALIRDQLREKGLDSRAVVVSSRWNPAEAQ